MSYCRTGRRLQKSIPALLAVIAITAITCSARETHAEELIRLTKDGTLKFTPVFVGNGRELMFVRFFKPTQLQIMRLNMADRSAQPLHEDEANHEFDIAVSRDGNYYAYVKALGTLSTSIEIRDAGGNQVGQVAPGDGFASYRSLAFAPDNSQLLFVFAAEVHQQIFSVRLAGDGRKQLTDSPGIHNWPCFSPDGKQIVFGSTRDGNYEIYKMQADGSRVSRLTDSPTMDLRPQYSPDGRHISFTSNRDGNYEIYIMHADGSGTYRVTNNPERDDYAAWHPDGSRLVIVSERNGSHDLYLVTLSRER